ncbi:hypothetical protein Q5752_001989 [Cryptotrichosporon argae]
MITRPPTGALAFLTASALALVFLVSRITPPADARWPGLLPSRYPALAHLRYNESFPLLDSSSPLEPAPPPAQLQATLDTLYARFATVWAAHSSAPPPRPVYAAPHLTPAQRRRYAHLRAPSPRFADRLRAKGRTWEGKYMFATVTRNIGSQLPDLINALFLVTTFLGPEHVSFSILEGPSDDPTPHVLREVLHTLLVSLGVRNDYIKIETDAPNINFDEVNRIAALAELRNQALAPLWDDLDSASPFNVGTDVVAAVFFNDVFLRAADFLEVLHQHVTAAPDDRGTGVGITTGWDWMSRDPDHFYDVWVARTIDTGDLFYPIDWPWWSPSTDLFPTSPASKAAYDALEPFQAFSSWNALAVLAPAPFLPPFNVRFRRGDESRGECAASECTLLASDFWKVGWGRVQVVPSVQLAYDRDTAVKSDRMLRQQQWDLGWIDGVPPAELDTTVRWSPTPPEKVRCHPWPDQNGLAANVWATTQWVPPYL